MAIHDWASISWPAFRAVPTARAVAVLPLGAIEAHGPHLPLGTDVVIAGAMARAGAERLAERGYEVVILPPIPVAPAPFAAAFPGTIDTPGSATTAIIAGIAESIARHGIPMTVIANAHHDPAHVSAVWAAVRLAADRGATLVFPDLTRRRWAARLTREFQSGACHAGRYESSIVLAVADDLVDVPRMRTLAPNPHSLVDAIQRGDATFDAAGGPEAYFGWPAESSAEEGQQILDTLGAIIEEAVLEAAGSGASDKPNHDLEAGPQAGATGSGLLAVNPDLLPTPRGFSHGVVAPAGWSALSVAGQAAAGGKELARLDFVTQFDRALANVLAVVRASGATPAHVTRMTVYVTDMDVYRASRASLGPVWRQHMGRHYPAMALVAVSGLVDPGAVVEIQADAVIPPRDAR